MPTRNRTKSLKQAFRSVAYRLRGKDPVTFRRGRLFEGEPQPVRHWLRKQKRVIPIRLKMKWNEWVGNPTPWVWNPTPPRVPKLLRVVRTNISKEATALYQKDPSFIHTLQTYRPLSRYLASLQHRFNVRVESHRKERLLGVDELPPSLKRLYYRIEDAESTLHNVFRNAIKIYATYYRRCAVEHAVTWSLHRMGYPMKARAEMEPRVVEWILSKNARGDLTHEKDLDLSQLFTARKSREFLNKYHDVYAKLYDEEGIGVELWRIVQPADK